MKLVNQYLDPDEAATARQSLRDAGVASIVDTMDPHSVQPSKSGVTHIGLWVLVDDQLEDAIEILENPGYVPQKFLSPREIEILETAAEKRAQSARRPTDRLMALIFFFCLLGLIAFTAVDFFLGS